MVKGTSGVGTGVGDTGVLVTDGVGDRAVGVPETGVAVAIAEGKTIAVGVGGKVTAVGVGGNVIAVGVGGKTTAVGVGGNVIAVGVGTLLVHAPSIISTDSTSAKLNPDLGFLNPVILKFMLRDISRPCKPIHRGWRILHWNCQDFICL